MQPSGVQWSFTVHSLKSLRRSSRGADALTIEHMSFWVHPSKSSQVWARAPDCGQATPMANKPSQSAL
jgi:hypothetical protein